MSERMDVQVFVTSFQELMDSGKHSDLTIKCCGQEIKAHRAIVGPRSRLLATMIACNFKESEVGVIELHADPPEMVKKMIQFLYTSRYDDNHGNVREHDASSESHERLLENAEGALLTNSQLFVLGDTYDIPGLKQYAKSRYEEVAKYRWSRGFFSQAFAVSTRSVQGLP